MQRLQGIVNFLAVSSGITHFFCCGIPVIFSFASLLVNLGLSASVPMVLEKSNLMPAHTVAVISVSGLVLAIGWLLHYLAYRNECNIMGCCETPCQSKKKRSGKILTIASLLFIVNLGLYLLLDLI